MSLKPPTGSSDVLDDSLKPPTESIESAEVDDSLDSSSADDESDDSLKPPTT